MILVILIKNIRPSYFSRMIQIYYTYTYDLLESKFENLIPLLPLKAKSKCQNYKRNEDKLLLLASYALLSKMLADKGYSAFQLADLLFSEAGRPYFMDSPFDFNISHTDHCAAVVFLENGRVGIDIEVIKAVDLSDYEETFSEKEWQEINSSEHKINKFYDYWTLLESALKADGRGLSLLSSPEIKIKKNQVVIDGKEWFSRHEYFDSEISCCITSNADQEVVELLEIRLV